jgi:hypothetical protein
MVKHLKKILSGFCPYLTIPHVTVVIKMKTILAEKQTIKGRFKNDKAHFQSRV